MSEEIAISVQGVSKAYRIWESPAGRLTSPIFQKAAGLFPAGSSIAQSLENRAAKNYRDFWALKDISFEVKKGESVGIIGRNGSGKSTILQIIAGTLQPTSGTVKVNGRVAALLELGSGFNPEFTGRENVYLNAAVLGLSKHEVDAKFDAIAAFADIGDFIDQPVKTYSSGMMVRLAFAVQIQLDPEILIVDEALAVGDEPFQRKCFNQITLMKERGVSILFVSHSAATVIELCERAVLLDRGEQLLTARPKLAVQHYHQLCYANAENFALIRGEIAKLGASQTSEQQSTSIPSRDSTPPPRESAPRDAYYLESMVPSSRSEMKSRGALIRNAYILTEDYKPVNVLVKGHEYWLRWHVYFSETRYRVRFGWTVKTMTGIVISGSATHIVGDGFEVIHAGQNLEISFKFRGIFNYGTYFLDLNARAELGEPEVLVHSITDALMFKMQPTPHDHRNGYMDCSIEPVWSVSYLA